jgi:hypothetical protein
LNRLHGFLRAPEGELLILGDRDPSRPALELDTLVIALRNAYGVSPVYQGALGCSIDPRVAEDPWRIQDVRIFGMPPSCTMAARHVNIDYELKKAAAGILVDGTVRLPSLFELKRVANAICASGEEVGQDRSEAHRYWFYPWLVPSPRFVREEDGVLIQKPVGVQVLTEKEFLDRTGQRLGATTASPEAQTFAKQVTQLLTSQTVPRYAALVSDFRAIELARVLRYERIPNSNLAYLLGECPMSEVDVPSVVSGIFRDEQGQVVCEGTITRVATGLQHDQRVQRYRYAYRGGVEARIELIPDQFVADASGIFAKLKARVFASRPSKHALTWHIGF